MALELQNQLIGVMNNAAILKSLNKDPSADIEKDIKRLQEEGKKYTKKATATTKEFMEDPSKGIKTSIDTGAVTLKRLEEEKRLREEQNKITPSVGRMEKIANLEKRIELQKKSNETAKGLLKGIRAGKYRITPYDSNIGIQANTLATSQKQQAQAQKDIRLSQLVGGRDE